MSDHDALHKKSLLAGWHVFMIASGGIIGAGLFVGTSAAISGAGPAVLLSYAFAALLTTIMMRMLYVLYNYSSQENNFLGYLKSYLGTRLACLAGWLYVFLWSVTAAAQSVAGGIILSGTLSLSAPQWSILLMCLGLFLNLLPVRFYGYSEGFLSSVKFIILLLFFIPCAIWIYHTPTSGHIVWNNLTQYGGILPFGIAGIASIVPMIVQDFTGCETAFLACQESENPKDSMRSLTKLLPIFITFIYIACVFSIIALVPWDKVKAGTSPFSTTLDYLGWHNAGFVTKIMTLVAILSCLNSAQYVISRTFQSLAQINCAPHKLVYKNKFGVPVYSVLLGSFTAFIPVFLACTAPTQFYISLLDTSGNMILIIWAMVCFAGAKSSQKAHDQFNKWQGFCAAIAMAIIFVSIILMPATSWTGISASAIALIVWMGTKMIPAKSQ